MFIAKIKYLKTHQGFIKYFTNTSWLFAEKIFRIITGLVTVFWVARYLGPEQFGLFSYAQSFVGLFVAIATLGLDSIVVRELVKDASKEMELIGTAFWLKVCGALVILPIIAISVGVTTNDNQTNLLIFIIASSVIFQSFNVIDSYFQSKVLSKYAVLANTTMLCIGTIMKIALILNDAELVYFAYAVLFDNIVLAIAFIYFYFKQSRLTFFQWKFHRKTAHKLLTDSWPLILTAISVSIYMKVNQVMVQQMLGNTAVGYYAAAVKLSEVAYLIPGIIVSSLFPAVINAKQNNEKLYYNRLQNLFTLLAWLAILIALPVTFLSDYIVHYLYGNLYSQASSVLAIHIWAGFFVFLSVASGIWFINENIQIFDFYRNFLGLLINILLNYFLIPLYGITGAASAAVVSYIFSGLLFDLYHKKTRIIFWMKLKTMFFRIGKL